MTEPIVRSGSLKGAALITGGAKRIGRAMALALAARGYRIALHYRSSLQDAERTCREIRRTGKECLLFPCDLSDIRQVRSLIPSVFHRLPDCNLLINNASTFETSGFLEMEEEVFDRHLTVNFKAPLFLARDFARHCRQGQIINMLDTRIMTPDPAHFAYTLSKKALWEFTRMAARDLAPGIRVNAIAPGLILPPEGENEAYIRNRIASIPLKSQGDVETILGALSLFLDHPFLTGDCIFVDGGEHLR